MEITLTLGSMYATDTYDIKGIEEKDDSIVVHWQVHPNGHIYTDIRKDTIIQWYHEYAGGNTSLT